MQRNKTEDVKIAERILGIVGYALDMCFVFKPYDKVDLNDVLLAFRSITQKAGIGISRKCDVEEYVSNAYSGYMRRFARIPRKLIVEQYGDQLGDNVQNAHKALIADKPSHIIEDDRVMVELKGGHVDYDSLSDPRYIMIQKVALTPKITAVKVIVNSMLQKYIWKEFANINAMVGILLSSHYKCEILYGRVTAVSSNNETAGMITRGKLHELVTEKGVLQEELGRYNLDINGVLDTIDSSVGALHAGREIRAATGAIRGICQDVGAMDSYASLINYIEKRTIPQVRDKKKLPDLAKLTSFSKQFIEKESKIIETLDGRQVNGAADALGSAISAYLTYWSLLNVDPQAEDLFAVMKMLDGGPWPFVRRPSRKSENTSESS